jgi:peptidyl-prolyl cis-trans isomerase SurA
MVMAKRNQWIRAFALSTVACAAVASSPREARAVTVEKIVAVVGDDAVLLSDLRARATPFLRQIARQYPPGPERLKAEDGMLKDLLQKMVEDLLEQQAAERLKVVVKPDEIDRSFEQMAAGQNMTVDQLFDMTEKKTGMSEQDYRDEIRRQILEGKLLSQRIRGRVRITEEDLRKAYQRALKEDRERREYRPAWIALRILPGASPQAVTQRMVFANAIHDDLDKGVPFADLALSYSEDPRSKENGGDLGIHAPAKSPSAQMGRRPVLAKELEEKLLPLEPGEYTAPFRFGDAIVILTVLSRQPSRYTTYEAAKAELIQRVQNEVVAKERAIWLEELKKRTHVEVRRAQ